MGTTTETTLRIHSSGVILRRDQNELGADEIRRRFRAGELVRIARGIYIRHAEVKSWEVVYLPSAETMRVTPDQGPSRA